MVKDLRKEIIKALEGNKYEVIKLKEFSRKFWRIVDMSKDGWDRWDSIKIVFNSRKEANDYIKKKLQEYENK